jgi:hypothetical protein
MIDDTFQKLKFNLELTPNFSGIVSQRHKAVRSVIENERLSINTKLIGSLSRQTRIQPRPGDQFDIDILAVLGSFDRWVPSGTGTTTQMAMNMVHEAVASADRYAKMNPEQDHPTVTFDYANNVKIELVPAYLDNIGHSSDGSQHAPKGRAYWIPARNAKWELADYDYGADYISGKNQACNGLLIPTVKMLKAAKRWHFPAMKSYHLEVIATDLVPRIIEDCGQKSLTPTYPLLVANCLYLLEVQLEKTWQISGSLSPPFTIDPSTRAAIGPKVTWLGEQAKRAHLAGTDRDKHEVWKTIFGEVLPLP